MLFYSKYFFICTQFCLTTARKTKIAESDLSVCFIRSISTKSISICSIFIEVVSTGDAYAENTYINLGLFDINS